MEKTHFSSDSPSFLTSSTLGSTSTSTSTSTSEIQNKAMDFLDNKYVKAVLYIILILYASIIAPKLPNWIMPYLEEPFVKIFIVLLIGLLATKDPTAAIIATIGVTVTYLFIKDYKFSNIIKNINYDENKAAIEKKLCTPNAQIAPNAPNTPNAPIAPIKKTVEQFNIYENFEDAGDVGDTEDAEYAKNAKYGRNFNTDTEYFNTSNDDTIQNIEHFDVMHNNNSFIDHREEHFNTN